MSRTKFDNILRTALWNSYNNKCFYCNQTLSWDELHIDHLIPESIAANIVRFSEIILDYELGNDFGINDLYNLVPVHSRCNYRKQIFYSPKKLLYFI